MFDSRGIDIGRYDPFRHTPWLFNPIALRTAKTMSFGRSKCNKVKIRANFKYKIVDRRKLLTIKSLLNNTCGNI